MSICGVEAELHTNCIREKSEIRGEDLPQHCNCNFSVYYKNKTETPKGQSEEAQTSFVREQK